jgi:non-ribosomal peptide synthetase component F
MHHIITDGVSMAILVKEFMSLYKGAALPPLRVQYKDFAAWQSRLIGSGELKPQEEYWLNRFKKDIPEMAYSIGSPRDQGQLFEGEELVFEIEGDLTARLSALTRSSGGTLYMILLAAFNILLARYTEREDIVVGSPITGRRHADLQDTIGMFVNMLPMRNRPTGHKTFRQFLEEVRTNCLDAYENQDYQFDDLVSKLGLQRIPGQEPLVNVVFVLQNIAGQLDWTPRIEIPELTASPYSLPLHVAKFDIVLTAEEAPSTITFTLEYRPHVFQRTTIEAMIRYFKNIIREIVANPEVKITDIQMIDGEERRQLQQRFREGIGKTIVNNKTAASDSSARKEAGFNF